MPSKVNRILATSAKGTHTRPPSRLPAIPVPGVRSPQSAPTRSPEEAASTIDLNLYPSDKDALRELSLYIVGQGRNVNRSVLIRAAIQTAKRDDTFLAAYEAIEARDPRRRKRS